MKYKMTLIAATLAALTLPVHAQTTAPATSERAPMDRPAGATATTPAAPAAMNRDRPKGADRNDVKDTLEQALKAATSRDDYRMILEKQGYKISSINSDKKEYLEYEIVKGDKSYEVQLDFNDGAPKATKIDVTANMWRSESTKQMMKDPNYKATAPLAADPDAKFSDRKYMKGWNDEKEKLEKSLATNMKSSDYKAQIEKMGYQITSVNDKEKDYVEYEIVKGDNSYEVQIDLDEKGMGKKVDVTTNAWETDSTERAKGDKK